VEQDASRRWRGCNKLLSERRQKRSTNREVFMQREGMLHILWMNSAAHNEVPSYHVEFADYQSGGVKKMRTIRGNEQLRSFLGRKIEVHPQTIESAFAGLKGERTANILNVVLPDDKLARLGLL